MEKSPINDPKSTAETTRPCENTALPTAEKRVDGKPLSTSRPAAAPSAPPVGEIDYCGHRVIAGTPYDLDRKISVGTAQNNEVEAQTMTVGKALEFLRSDRAKRELEIAFHERDRIANALCSVWEEFQQGGVFDLTGYGAFDGKLSKYQREQLLSELTALHRKQKADATTEVGAKLYKLAWSMAKVRCLRGLMWTGIFSLRKKEGLTNPSGLMVLDCDRVPDVETTLNQLRHDPLCFSLQLSPSGTGIKIEIRVPDDAAWDTKKWRACFSTFVRYIEKQYPGCKLNVDEAAKAVPQLCFVTHDPKTQANVNAYVLLPDPDLLEDKKATKSKAPQPATRDRSAKASGSQHEQPKTAREYAFDGYQPAKQFETVQSAVESLTDWLTSLPEGGGQRYEPWRNLFFAVGRWAKSLEDEGLKAEAKAWLCGFAEANYGNFGEALKTAFESADGSIGLGTLFKMAREHGNWQAPWKNGYEKQTVILPTQSNSAFCRQVYDIIAQTNTLFLQGGETVCIEVIEGQPQIVTVDAIKGIRLFEQHIQFLKKDEDDEGDAQYVPVPLSEHHSKLLVKGVQPGELPELKGITRCPPLIPTTDGKNLQPAGQGYIPETGWFNVSEFDVPDVPLAEAVESLKWLYREFDFPTVGDRSRALVYPIGIALKLSGFIQGFVPLAFGSANTQQSGKGTLQRMTAAFFGYRMEIITQSESHIGGTAESFKASCLAGKPFIQLDNFDHYSCREMEAFLTGERVRMRAAYGRSGTVDPTNYFICISSNGLAARKDLAERTWFIRIHKKPDDHQFYAYEEGGIIAHVLKNHHYYLGCIYSIIQEWWTQGKHHTDETRHSFREFTQVCDWIAQNVLGEVGVMDGHAEAAGLYGDAGRVFFSRIWDTVEKQGKLNHLFKATQLAMMAFRFSIPVPGAVGRARNDEEAAAKLVGAVAADLFSDANPLDLGQGHIVQRVRGRPPDQGESDWDDDDRPYLPRGKNAFCYIFKNGAQEKVSNPGPPGTNRALHERIPIDWLVQFRNDVVAALEEAGKPERCEVSTAEIAAFFKEGSVDSVGRWMANLAQHWPEQFKSIRTKDYRGWMIIREGSPSPEPGALHPATFKCHTNAT